MTLDEARATLNAARDGRQVSSYAIHQSLIVTGDIDDEEPDANMARHVVRPSGSWERGACGMLAAAQPFDGLLA